MRQQWGGLVTPGRQSPLSRQTPAGNVCLICTADNLFGGVGMRKMCRVLADRTRSDERALRYGIVALALSLATLSLLKLLVA
jgi:hypothetical protein